MSARPDLLVVGGGTAGIVGARTAASLGADVLLVEMARTGGECLWTGCVPSKALLAAAAADAGDPMAAVRAAIARVAPADSPQSLRAAGVAVRTGTVCFTGPRTLEVDGQPLGFAQALIATGSVPVVPSVDGLRGVLTTETFWDLEALPTSLVVLGGGSIGAEIAQACSRLGVNVELVETADRLLPGEDPDAAAVVAAALVGDGVRLHTGRHAVTATAQTLALDDGTMLTADRVLAATGRRARIDGLGLAAAGVELDGTGHVAVDNQLRTTNPRISAAGDVTRHPAFTHVAGMHASVAATNAVLGLRRAAPVDALPRVTFTSPELAAVGCPTTPASGRVLHTLPATDVDRAIIEGDTAGFARIATDRRKHIRGATVVGPRAGEVLAELTLAVGQGMTLRDLAASVHPYPTWGDLVWNAAIGDVREGIASGSTRAAIRALGWARRNWLRRQDRAAGQRSAR